VAIKRLPDEDQEMMRAPSPDMSARSPSLRSTSYSSFYNNLFNKTTSLYSRSEPIQLLSIV
jgi:hypothetical protein